MSAAERVHSREYSSEDPGTAPPAWATEVRPPPKGVTTGDTFLSCNRCVGTVHPGPIARLLPDRIGSQIPPLEEVYGNDPSVPRPAPCPRRCYRRGLRR